MDVQVLTRTFAEVVSYGPDLINRDEIEVAGEQEAIQFCLDHGKLYFETSEISEAVINGETYRTDPKNHSERRYVGLSTLHGKSARIKQMGEDLELMRLSLDDLNSELEKSGVTALDDEKVEKRDRLEIECETLQNQRFELENDSSPQTYVDTNENNPLARKPEYIRLNEGEIVYNPQGKQIWPPAPQ